MLLKMYLRKLAVFYFTDTKKQYMYAYKHMQFSNKNAIQQLLSDVTYCILITSV